MRYDIRLALDYEYDPPVAGGRHIVRVAPLGAARGQRVVAASVDFDPPPVERVDDRDFFGNSIVRVAYREAHARLRVTMAARVAVEAESAMFNVSPDLATLQRELATVRSLDPNSPHHYSGPSPRAPLDRDIAAWAAESVAPEATVRAIVSHLGRRIHREFLYDLKSTAVETPARQAFDMRRGVCQDFSHVMIVGLRGVGIPAGYVSGFLRTIPPPGKERLAGADAMHAWVMAWCGNEAGWVGYDPTNAVFAGEEHILVAVGRDYQDVAPIGGVLRMSGRQSTRQSVDVEPV